MARDTNGRRGRSRNNPGSGAIPGVGEPAADVPFDPPGTGNNQGKDPTATDPQPPGRIASAINRGLTTAGILPNIDYDRLGDIMESAVSRGMKQSEQSLAVAVATGLREVQATGPARPPRTTQQAATTGGRRRPRQRGEFPTLGLGGMAGTLLPLLLGSRLFREGPGGGGLFGTPGVETTPPGLPLTTAAQVQAYTAAAAAGGAAPPGQPPGATGGGPAPAEPPEGQPGPSGGPLPAASATGDVVADTAAAAAGAGGAGAAATTATGGAWRRAIGAGLMGYGASGVKGAWNQLRQTAPGTTNILEGGAIGLSLLTGGYDILNRIASQRQMGAYYQGILGGGIWSGEGQRVQQAGFRLSQLGNLSGAQANALFQGVTGLDMTGPQRANAMQQAVDMYDQLGVSIQTSLQNITLAAQNGNKELSGLAEAITNVSQAAQAGQVNANVARGMFTATSQAAAGVFQGPAVQAVASGITAAMVGGGQLLQGMDTSNLFSMQNMFLLAQQKGMGVDQFIYGIEHGHPEWFGQALTAQTLQFLPTQQITPYFQQALANMGIRPNRQGEFPKLTPAVLQQLGEQTTALDTQNPALGYQMMVDLQAAGFNVTSLPQAQQLMAELMTGQFGAAVTTGEQRFRRTTFGGQAAAGATAAQRRARSGFTYQQYTRPDRAGDYTAAAQYGVQQYLSTTMRNTIQDQLTETDPDLTGTELQNAVKQRIAELSKTAPYQPGGQVYEQYNNKAYAQRAFNERFNASKADQTQWRQAAKQIGAPDAWQQAFDFLHIGGQSDADQARSWYMQNVVKKRQARDPVMERILGDPSLNNKGTVYKVNLGNDKSTLANVSDLERDYMQYVQAGQVTVQTGKYQGQGIADIFGFQQQNVTKPSALSRSEQDRVKSQQGTLQGDVNKATAHTIYVKPSAALQNLLSFSTTAGSGIVIDANTSVGQTNPSYITPGVTQPNF